MDRQDEFTEFAAANAARLRRTAFLLCGDWHAAEDLTQIALTKTMLAWRRLRAAGNAPAYAHKTVVNAFLAQRRTRKYGELPVAELPDAAARSRPADLRLVLLQALGTLSPAARAVLILRYWEDMSIEQTAAVLGCSPGTVKSQSSRALAQVRALLADSAPELRLPD